MFDRVKMILYTKDNKEKSGFLDVLKNDESLSKHPKIHSMLRHNVIDITPQITGEQITLLDPNYSGGRTRRRRRKTRRKVWR